MNVANTIPASTEHADTAREQLPANVIATLDDWYQFDQDGYEHRANHIDGEMLVKAVTCAGSDDYEAAGKILKAAMEKELAQQLGTNAGWLEKWAAWELENGRDE